jgi:hypothetical protein
MNNNVKVCADCFLEKKLCTKPGNMSRCDDCRKEKCRVSARKWRLNNPEKSKEHEERRSAESKAKRKENNKKYREENADVIRAKKRESYFVNKQTYINYYQNNKERIAEYGKSDHRKSLNKALYDNNKPKEKERKAIAYKKDPKKIIKRTSAYIKQKNRTDPVFKMLNKIRNGTYRAFNFAKIKKNSRSFELLGCSMEEFISHFNALFKEGMNWENHGKWEIDHIVPLAIIQMDELDLVKKLCHYTNLQPLWKTDHERKTVEDLKLIKKAKKR